MADSYFRDLYLSDRTEVERHIKVVYDIEPGPNYSADEAAARLLLITTRRTIEPSWYDPRPDHHLLGAILNRPHYGQGQPWATVELALPSHIARPEEGLGHLLMILTSPVEYEYTNKLWVRQLQLPSAYLRHLSGPRLGVSGIREITGVAERPLVGLVIRPRTGVPIRTMLDVGSRALAGGVDFLVDDLLMGNPAGPMSFRRRVPHFVGVCDRASTSTAHKLYFANLSGSPRSIYADAVWAVENGVGGLVVDPFTLGFGALQDLTDLLDETGSSVPILATNMGSGIASRVPNQDEPPASQAGLDEAVIARLSRLGGADGVHVGTTDSECYHVEWGDAVSTLSSPIRTGQRKFRPSFRIAEGDLQIESVWRNINELGHDSSGGRRHFRRDVMLEVTNGILNFEDERGRPNPEEGARVFRAVLDVVWKIPTEDEAKANLYQLGLEDGAVQRCLEARGVDLDIP